MPQDDTEALQWFSRAANQGNALAQYNLGVSCGAKQRVPVIGIRFAVYPLQVP
ncbi:MAG: hypothetical protein WB662_14885 [Methyloceanibacter sp.]